MVTTLRTRYIHLAEAVHALWPAAFSSCCANCKTICCRPHMADEILSGSWLSEIARLEAGDWSVRPGPRHARCAALGPNGCIFTAAKPPFCRSFYCDALLNAIADPAELAAALFLSNILTDTCRLNRRHNLLSLPLTDGDENRILVEAALRKGEENLALYRWFCRQTSEAARFQGAFKMLCRMPFLLTRAVANTLNERLGTFQY